MKGIINSYPSDKKGIEFVNKLKKMKDVKDVLFFDTSFMEENRLILELELK